VSPETSVGRFEHLRREFGPQVLGAVMRRFHDFED
jgi:hypothetical protein